MGHIIFCIAVIIIRRSRYMEIVGGTYAAVGNNSFYSRVLVN